MRTGDVCMCCVRMCVRIGAASFLTDVVSAIFLEFPFLAVGLIEWIERSFV